ncbi:MAG: hypothetical protein A2X48_05860 [Lentisphaerae bacterium GWF2_49_21]|nr:MAG: hypothetical protein A2X48_05860 [Lentisphaerae bacterium GWF2_49_21]
MKKKASNAEILKQVLYEMLTLAYTIDFLARNKWQKGQSHIDSSEVLQSIASIKIRLLYDFLYSQEGESKAEGAQDVYSAIDDFKIKIKKPFFVGCGPKGMFSTESVDKYILHFTEERISKPKELPEPRFKGGTESIIKNTALILSSAEKFIDAQVKGSFMNLNQESENYLKDFKQTVVKLKEFPAFKASYH